MSIRVKVTGHQEAKLKACNIDQGRLFYDVSGVLFLRVRSGAVRLKGHDGVPCVYPLRYLEEDAGHFTDCKLIKGTVEIIVELED